MLWNRSLALTIALATTGLACSGGNPSDTSAHRADALGADGGGGFFDRSTRWIGGIPGSLVQPGLDFIDLPDSRIGIDNGQAYFLPSKPMAELVFRESSPQPKLFALPPIHSVGYGVTIAELALAAPRDPSKGSLYVQLHDDAIEMHVEITGRVHVTGTGPEPDGDILLDHVDVSVFLGTNPETGWLVLNDVVSSVDYHYDFGGFHIVDWLIAKVLRIAKVDVPQLLNDGIRGGIQKQLESLDVQAGIPDVLARLEHKLSAASRIPLPALNVYPNAIYISKGDVCVRGYVCLLSSCTPPADDDRLVRCADPIATHGAAVSAVNALCPTPATRAACLAANPAEAATLDDATAAWRSCLEPACDSMLPKTY